MDEAYAARSRESEPSLASLASTPAAPIYCDGAEVEDQTRLSRGFSLMTKTTEGRQLYDQLIDKQICTGVEYIDFAAAYARPNPKSDWSASVIMVDRWYLRAVTSDIVAASLVHEAKHIDRAINGETCSMFDRCTVLDSGITVEEEMAAHGAEARWWIEIYGAGGRRVASGGGYFMDNLVFAYRQGPEAFREYVIQIRRESAEGMMI
jgi:hypothetical protein